MSKNNLVVLSEERLVLNAYTPAGEPLPQQKQVVWNSPAGEYLEDADETVVIVSSDDTVLPVDDKGVKQVVENFSEPVEIDGKEYRRDFAWGSGVKTGKTYGLQSDIFGEEGILRFQEDAYRMGRAYFANSTVAVRGGLTVMTVPVGTVIPGVGKVDDGFGYIRSSIADKMRDEKRFQAVSVGKWQSSFSFLQRYELTDELFMELHPIYMDSLEELSYSGYDLIDKFNWDLGAKGQFIEADEDMEFHPFVANSLTEVYAQRMIRVATNSGMMMDGGLFAPTTSDKLVLPKERFGDMSKAIITRYPIDGPGSIRAIEVEQGTEEEERIADLEVLQYTMTAGFDVSFKGLVGVVADEYFPEAVDLILCVEDEKLNSAWITESDIDKSESVRIFEDIVFSVTQWFTPGSAIGVPGKLAKDLNADYDGDSGAIVSGDKFPEMLRQTEGFKQLQNPKLPKTKTPTVAGESRSYRALLSMANLVGHATNVVATVLGVVDQEWLANQLGWATADEMHEYLMFAIKVGTDIFKTSADYRPVVKRLSHLNSRLSKLGVRAPYTTWMKSETAFRNEMPIITDPQAEGISEWEKKNAILPDGMEDGKQDAIIPTLLRWVLPQMFMPETTPVKPLANFKDWALESDDEPLNQVLATLLSKYAARIKSMNFQDDKAWNSFVSEWSALLTTVCNERNIDRYELANAMWFSTHSNQRMSKLSKIASAVFVGMPEESVRIISEKPGLLGREGDYLVDLVGIHYQLPTATDGMTFAVEVVDFKEIRKGGIPVSRKAVVVAEALTGQVQPTDKTYPANTIAVMALQSSSPSGSYTATLKNNNKVWQADMVAA